MTQKELIESKDSLLMENLKDFELTGVKKMKINNEVEPEDTGVKENSKIMNDYYDGIEVEKEEEGLEGENNEPVYETKVLQIDRKEEEILNLNCDDLMSKLNDIAFMEAEDSNLKRENANVDGNTPMGLMLQYGSLSSKELAKKVLDEKYLYPHRVGDIHIHDLDFVSTGTTTCSQIDLSKLFKGGFSTGHGYLREPQSIRAYGSLAAIAIQSNQNSQHGGQSIPSFDYYMRDGVVKSFKKNVKNNISKFIDIMFSLQGEDLEEITELIWLLFQDIESIYFSEEELSRLELDIDDILLEKEIGELNDDFGYNLVEFVLRRAYNETDNETYQSMEAFIHNLNTMNSRAGSQTPFSSINFGTDTTPEGRMVSKNLLLAHEAGLGKGETPIFPILIFKVKDGINLRENDPNYDLFELACRVSSKRMFPNFAFLDSPENLKYYEEGNFDSEVAYMGCRSRTMGNIHGEEITTGRGNISFTSINLPRIGINHGSNDREKSNMKGFYQELDSKMDLIVEQLMQRFEFQGKKKVKNFPFLMGEGVWMGSEKLRSEDRLREVLKEGSLTVGFIGLAETLTMLNGKHHGESKESQKLGLEIIGFMRDKLDMLSKKHDLNFALIATPAEGLSGRFLKLDREKYGIIKGVTDKDYYTNSFHVPVNYDITIYDKINIEAPYHDLTNGGHISYIELDGDVSKNQEAFKQVITAMAESGIGYGSINHPIDKDPVCGYQGVIYNECPKCGRKPYEDGIPFDRIRRITGYLVGTTDRFNDAKKAEERDRVKHNRKHI